MFKICRKQKREKGILSLFCASLFYIKFKLSFEVFCCWQKFAVWYAICKFAKVHHKLFKRLCCVFFCVGINIGLQSHHKLHNFSRYAFVFCIWAKQLMSVCNCECQVAFVWFSVCFPGFLQNFFPSFLQQFARDWFFAVNKLLQIYFAFVLFDILCNVLPVLFVCSHVYIIFIKKTFRKC